MGSVSNQQFTGGCAKAAEKAPEEAPADAARAADEPQLLHGAGICKWFNVRMGFGFLSMTARAGVALDPPVDVFVHQCYNCGGLDHHAKECKLPPQPKKCHFCQSINHMVASCPLKAQQAPSSQGKPAYFQEEEEEINNPALLPEAQN
uniref:CCHC-type domain-containing protein n=1 Tax=Cavia porcellus TaxID=10141 RepID=H0VY72_CAVPO